MVHVLWVFLFTCSSAIANHSFSENFYRYAQTVNDASNWTSTHCINKQGELLISRQELVQTLNFFYIAYQRSASTLKAHKNSLDFLHNTWHSWQHIIQRRRNPSKTTTFGRCHFTIEQQAKEFARCAHEHDYWASTYDQITRAIFNEGSITNPNLLAALTHIKKDARTLVTNALLSVNEYVEQLVDAFAGPRCIIPDEGIEIEEEGVRSSIMEYLKEHLPGLGIASYTKADNLFISTSLTHWNALYHAQKISAVIWNAIEKDRAHFYYIYYKTLYQRTQELGSEQYPLLFDTNGPIASTKEVMTLLPSPDTISPI